MLGAGYPKGCPAPKKQIKKPSLTEGLLSLNRK
jgi:hypothetical protein